MLEISIRERTERIPIEAECVAPDRLAGFSISEIERLPVQLGNQQPRLAEFFDVQGDPNDRELRLFGDWTTVKWVGMGMTGGRIVVEGDLGMHAGAEMVGGELIVHGNTGDWLGGEMVGGMIQVRGNAGHLVGSAYRGSKVGMRGGVVLVHGDAGNEIGNSMRRGLIAIGGRCGDFAGVSMIAGSIFVFGETGIRLGAGMKRGTIALIGQSDPPLLPTFRFDCDYSPDFLRLYLNQLRTWNFPPSREYSPEGNFRRWNGDLLELGKGEILAQQLS